VTYGRGKGRKKKKHNVSKKLAQCLEASYKATNLKGRRKKEKKTFHIVSQWVSRTRGIKPAKKNTNRKGVGGKGQFDDEGGLRSVRNTFATLNVQKGNKRGKKGERPWEGGREGPSSV